MVPRALSLLAIGRLAEAGSRAPPPFPASGFQWSVVLDEGRASLTPGLAARAAAWGSFVDAIETTGWGVLDVHSSAEVGGREQSYAAGFLEGALTHRRIAQHFSNIWGEDFADATLGKIPGQARSFIAANIAWMKAQVEKNTLDPYWTQISFLLSQLRGLTDGYNDARVNEPVMSEQAMLMLSLIGADMDDVLSALRGESKLDNPKMGHCSALVQIAPGSADLWVAHATFDNFRGMMRITKYFDMPLPGAAIRRMSFTSSPGLLYSGDDFYVTDAGLTVVETTIENYNSSLWALVAPESVLTWARAMVANRLAETGDAWTEILVKHNSGTCNNQWIVVDYKRFVPEQPLRAGTVWISETMPGYARRGDVTDVVLTQGSWPSYNIPYFRDIQRAGGYFAKQKQEPHKAEQYNYTQAPRARMFARARREGWVTSREDFMRLMRYNHLGDPLSKGDACNSISARCDLNPHSSPLYKCFGALDSKFSAYRGDVRTDTSFYGVAGPTHDDEKPFSWRLQNTSVDGCRPSQHVGQPETFDFGWYAFPSVLVLEPGMGRMGRYLGWISVALVCLGLLVSASRRRPQGIAYFPTSFLSPPSRIGSIVADIRGRLGSKDSDVEVKFSEEERYATANEETYGAHVPYVAI